MSFGTVHKHRNLLAQAPKRLHDEPTNDHRSMIQAETFVAEAGGLFGLAEENEDIRAEVHAAERPPLCGPENLPGLLLL